jgi:hypothetical protein
LLFFLAVALLCAASAVAEKAIPSITINGNTYSNVVVESVTAKTITFSHARGAGSFNPIRLTPEQRVMLGVIKEVADTKKETKAATARSVLDRWFPTDTEEQSRRTMGALALAIVGGIIILHLFTSLCLVFICKKTEHPAPFRAWIPGIQWLAAYKAAGMSLFWANALLADILFRPTVGGLVFTGVLTPSRFGEIFFLIITFGFSTVHVVGWITWCFKICTAREKSPWLGLLVLFPITHPPAMGYLAFSK